ncbi:TlpA disulfide reductase family protein [Croceiramulus getboli]|nr:TlpA disulfide reductase family protein [Flavobacteriaceae bacterium YJPT1-3]
MKSGVILLLVLLLVGCKQEKQEGDNQDIAEAQTSSSVPIYNFDQLEPLLQLDDDTVHVVNFWATWCKPCIKELPQFEALKSSYNNQEVDVLLVSLDFKEQLESQLLPFIKKRNIKSPVVFLDDPKGNTWIPKVDPDWSGAIPATIIYKNDRAVFFERSFEEGELEQEVLKFINNEST